MTDDDDASRRLWMSLGLAAVGTVGALIYGEQVLSAAVITNQGTVRGLTPEQQAALIGVAGSDDIETIDIDARLQTLANQLGIKNQEFTIKHTNNKNKLRNPSKAIIPLGKFFFKICPIYFICQSK